MKNSLDVGLYTTCSLVTQWTMPVASRNEKNTLSTLQKTLTIITPHPLGAFVAYQSKKVNFCNDYREYVPQA